MIDYILGVVIGVTATMSAIGWLGLLMQQTVILWH